MKMFLAVPPLHYTGNQSLPNFRRNRKFRAPCPMRRNWALGWERSFYSCCANDLLFVLVSACNRWIGPGSGRTRTGPDQLLGSCLEPLFSCILLLLWMLSLTEITYLNRKYSYVSECNEKTQSKGMQLRKTSARTSPDQSAG